MMKIRSLVTLTIAFMLGISAESQAAEIKVLSTNGVKTVLEELVPQFEKATAHKLVIKWGPAAELKVLIEKGETFDLAILTAAALDDLIKQGKLAAPTRADIARSGAGMAFKKGAPRPDIATTDAFKRTLVAAKSIAYVGTGATGGNMRKIFERLGIADEMKAKTKILSRISAADAAAQGDAELGIQPLSETMGVQGPKLAGPVPPQSPLYPLCTPPPASGAATTPP